MVLGQQGRTALGISFIMSDLIQQHKMLTLFQKQCISWIPRSKWNITWHWDKSITYNYKTFLQRLCIQKELKEWLVISSYFFSILKFHTWILNLEAGMWVKYQTRASTSIRSSPWSFVHRFPSLCFIELSEGKRKEWNVQCQDKWHIPKSNNCQPPNIPS